MEDVWAESHDGRHYLYFKTKHRFRKASGIYLYELITKDLTFRFGGVVFLKPDLAEEKKWSDSLK